MTAPTPRDEQFARFYDLEYRDHTGGLDFYLGYANALDPSKKLPVLELGCGTGRILFALAGAGFHVTGVDSSEEMIAFGRQRATVLKLSRRASFVRADMCDLGELAGGPFNMALCALNTFAYLQTTADQLAMLAAVRQVLVQHGILIIDLTSPLPHLLPPSDGEVVYQGSYSDPENGTVVHKYLAGHTSPASQTHHVLIMYDVEGADGSRTRFTQAQDFRWTGRFEMELLLERAGYRLEKLYGGYDLDEFGDESERMIFVARA